MSVSCTIGKDGKKYFFKDGVRVTSSKSPIKCSTSKKPTKKTSKKTTRKVTKKSVVPMKDASELLEYAIQKAERKPTKKTTRKVTKKSVVPMKDASELLDYAIQKASQKPAKKAAKKFTKKLWLMKLAPIFESTDGKFSEDLPNKNSELIGYFPLKMVRPVEVFELQKDRVEELHHGNDYWVVDSEDRTKLLRLDEDSDPRKLKVKNYLNHIWEFGNLKVKGESIPTFIKPVRAYFGPSGPKKEVKVTLPSGKKYVWANQKVHEMMSEITDARSEWNVEQWNAFLSNMLVNGYILSNLHPL